MFYKYFYKKKLKIRLPTSYLVLRDVHELVVEIVGPLQYKANPVITVTFHHNVILSVVVLVS